MSFSGVGFVLTNADPFVAIDIDGCIQDSRISDATRQLIETFDSYTEISPSGQGIRIMIKGQMPLGMSNRFSLNGAKGVEIYAHSRYVTITGAALNGTPSPLRDFDNDQWSTILELLGQSGSSSSTGGVSRVSTTVTAEDQRNIERLEHDEKHGSEFRALFHYGDLARYGGDQSKADLRLTTLVANVVGFDETAIDRIIRASKLFRKKWDTRHRNDGATYGQMTIEKVLLTRFVRHKGETEGFLRFHYGFRYNEVRGMVEWHKRGVPA